MPIEIQLPRLGWSMEEGKFLEWLKQDGDCITAGEPLFILESDKAAQEVESIESGILSIPADGPRPGDIIKVGQILGYLLAEGDTAPTPSSPVAESAPDQLAHHSGSPILQHSSTPPLPPASPRARRAAREHQVDLSTLAPTGQGGRIRERDVLAAVPSIATSGMQIVPLTSMRRTIAARLMHSRQTTVPVTITGRCDATALLSFRQQLKSLSPTNHHSGTPAPHHSIPAVPTINDILVKLTATALRQHPMLSATWMDDHLLLPARIHLGIAVDTESGLLVPVIRDVDTSTLSQVAAQSQKLIAAARTGQLATADMQGACFTLSNLGSLGVEFFTPVINPPESAILGIGAIVREAVPLDDGTFTARDRLSLSLTFDHRVNDGAAAARFLQTLRHLIEQPLLGLV